MSDKDKEYLNELDLIIRKAKVQIVEPLTETEV